MGEKARPALTRKPGNLLRRNGEVSSAESSSSESAAGEKSVRIFPGFALPFGWPLSMNLESGVLLLCGDIRAPLKTTLLGFGRIFCPNNAF